MLYETLRRLLFMLDPESAHGVIHSQIGWASHLGLNRLVAEVPPEDPVTVMGIRFPNTIGLAAGFDKNADMITPLGAMGFGHIEVGTLTPLPQPGNPRPRCFRIVEKSAVINRMGFNNCGVEQAMANLERSAAGFRLRGGVVGINIGKNASTPVAEAVPDYLKALEAVYEHADYVAVNVSCPNQKDLCDLQGVEYLRALMTAVMKKRDELAAKKGGRPVPVAVKLSPDLSDDELKDTADLLLELGVDGVIATNTTTSRPGLDGIPTASQQGGLSGKPLGMRSTEVIRIIHEHTGGKLPILASGGVMSAADALEKVKAGASVVQLYTGFIYSGPQLITDSVRAIQAHRRDHERPVEEGAQ